jgi:hypothetical protein
VAFDYMPMFFAFSATKFFRPGGRWVLKAPPSINSTRQSFAACAFFAENFFK